MNHLIDNYKEDAIASFRSYKSLAERAIGQVSDEEFFATIDQESNSIALIVKHIAGNQRSRWRDFLNSDGEKPDRARDTEFELLEDTRELLMNRWEEGWQILFDALEPLNEDDFGRIVSIRGEPHTVIEAVNRQLTHYAYHVGQIVFLAKHLRAADWKSLSVPRGRSAEFNQFLAEQPASGVGKPDRLDVPAAFAASIEKPSEPTGEK
ncbi:MAG TPA: DUF1572 family protein [Pyrinomonadaceae bacterium]|nr:DUF1572 family protein [Chloracidobacterium sp.]HRJ87705.1 DUF1572 family protein [Pyrinomonadaceae bacterium]HRK51137.1 DUF1572 family protein [Pyrinomonadaceae bacterium]